jgi:hypothetical protein
MSNIHILRTEEKMGHELHGDWHLYIVRAINSQGDLQLQPAGTIHLEMPDASTGVMQSGSKHGANDLVHGLATPVAGVYSVTFEEQLPASPPQFRPYAGFLIDRRDTPNGDRVLVMAGFRRRITTAVGLRASERDDAAEALLTSQEEGTWVATKP